MVEGRGAASRRYLLESDDGVSGLDVGDALSYGLDDTGTLVSQDDRERAFGVLAGQRVCICSTFK